MRGNRIGNAIRGVVRIGLAAVVLVTVACSTGSNPTPQPAASTAPPAAAAESTPPAAASATPKVTPTPNRLALPTPTPWPDSSPDAATGTPVWVPLARTDKDLSEGLIRDDELPSGWSKGDVTLDLLNIDSGVTCDGRAIESPVSSTAKDGAQYAMNQPAPIVLQRIWKFANDRDAQDHLDYVRTTYRCAAWQVVSKQNTTLTYDVRTFDFPTTGDESVATRLRVSGASGGPYEMVVVTFRVGAVVSTVAYIDQSAPDMAKLQPFVSLALPHVQSVAV